MNVYMYQADLYCENCTNEIGMVCHSEYHKPRGTNLCDSDCTPIGPYPDGGGEADCPNHCGGCGLFLENPLTQDGMDYVKDAIEDGTGTVVQEWKEFYDWI